MKRVVTLTLQSHAEVIYDQRGDLHARASALAVQRDGSLGPVIVTADGATAETLVFRVKPEIEHIVNAEVSKVGEHFVVHVQSYLMPLL
ncbi:MAG: hypothetical protein ACYDA1_06170 [Vulcanimicrobiaceae bacterium]